MPVKFGTYDSESGFQDDFVPASLDALQTDIDGHVNNFLDTPGIDGGLMYRYEDLTVTDLETAWEDLKNLREEAAKVCCLYWNDGELIESTVLIAFPNGEFFGYGAEYQEEIR